MGYRVDAFEVHDVVWGEWTGKVVIDGIDFGTLHCCWESLSNSGDQSHSWTVVAASCNCFKDVLRGDGRQFEDARASSLTSMSVRSFSLFRRFVPQCVHR